MRSDPKPEPDMATNQQGLPTPTRHATAPKAALALLGVALAACSTMPTGPETKLDRWDGKPVVTTSQNCGPQGCSASMKPTN
jgi:hypothetical protein